MLAYLGEKERARKWASIEPDDVMDQYNTACAFAQMGEPDQALDLLESGLRGAPQAPWDDEARPRFDALAWPSAIPSPDRARGSALSCGADRAQRQLFKMKVVGQVTVHSRMS
jgi:hypothetical protein